jgi:hypothetical protein
MKTSTVATDSSFYEVTAFWDTVLYSLVENPVLGNNNNKYIIISNKLKLILVEAERRFRGAYCLHHLVDEPDDGRNKHF